MTLASTQPLAEMSRVKTKCDGTRAETRFGLPAKRTSQFISAGVSVQSSTGFLGVRVGGERLRWTVPSQAEDCWLPNPFASFPFTSPPVRRRVPPDSVSTLPEVFPGGKGGRCLMLTTYHHPVVTKFGNLNFLEPSGPLQACNGTDLHLPFTVKLRQFFFADLKYI